MLDSDREKFKHPMSFSFRRQCGHQGHKTFPLVHRYRKKLNH